MHVPQLTYLPICMVAEKGHPPWTHAKAIALVSMLVIANVPFTQFIAIQYLMSFLIKLNDKYNTNKYVNIVGSYLLSYPITSL